MKVAILTNFKELHPGYSLTSIVSDQITMLQRYGHEVELFVAKQYSDDRWPTKVTCPIRKIIPHPELTDYAHSKDISGQHQKTAQTFANLLTENLKDFDLVFTHDFVLTGWNLPYYIGLKLAKDQTRRLAFLHWIHSVPSQNFNWWNIRTLGNNHKLVYPNKTDSLRVAEAYQGRPGDVRVIPHMRDLRTFFEFHEATCEFINLYPGVMNASIVQVYPASSDRFSAKRVRELILVFKEFKRRKFTVCLVIANQWATGRQRKENLERYRNIAHRNGLTDQEFVLTSEFKAPKFETGLPRRILRELMQCSNLFVFPTREESFGLVLPEASLASGCLTVSNRSLDMLMEVGGYNGLYFDFGSYFRNFKPNNERSYYHSVASVILARMKEDDGIQARTWMRRQYNMDSVYRRFYEPIMHEAKHLWVAA